MHPTAITMNYTKSHNKFRRIGVTNVVRGCLPAKKNARMIEVDRSAEQPFKVKWSARSENSEKFVWFICESARAEVVFLETAKTMARGYADC